MPDDCTEIGWPSKVPVKPSIPRSALTCADVVEERLGDVAGAQRVAGQEHRRRRSRRARREGGSAWAEMLLGVARGPDRHPAEVPRRMFRESGLKFSTALPRRSLYGDPPEALHSRTRRARAARRACRLVRRRHPGAGVAPTAPPAPTSTQISPDPYRPHTLEPLRRRAARTSTGPTAAELAAQKKAALAAAKAKAAAERKASIAAAKAKAEAALQAKLEAARKKAALLAAQQKAAAERARLVVAAAARGGHGRGHVREGAAARRRVPLRRERGRLDRRHGRDRRRSDGRGGRDGGLEGLRDHADQRAADSDVRGSPRRSRPRGRAGLCGPIARLARGALTHLALSASASRGRRSACSPRLDWRWRRSFSPALRARSSTRASARRRTGQRSQPDRGRSPSGRGRQRRGGVHPPWFRAPPSGGVCSGAAFLTATPPRRFRAGRRMVLRRSRRRRSSTTT